MFDEVFKQRVIDKLISLVKTPNFDKIYTVVLKRDINGPSVVVCLNNKETFRIYPSYGGGRHYYTINIPDEESIDIAEYGSDYNKTNLSYLKAQKLNSLLWDIGKKREEKQKKDEALQKEREQQDRLLAAKQKQKKLLSGLDSLINISIGYPR